MKKVTLCSQVQLIWINIATKSFLKGLWRKDRSLRRVLKHSMNFLVRQECGAMSVRWLITYQNFGTRPDLVKNRKENHRNWIGHANKVKVIAYLCPIFQSVCSHPLWPKGRFLFIQTVFDKLIKFGY